MIPIRAPLHREADPLGVGKAREKRRKGPVLSSGVAKGVAK